MTAFYSLNGARPEPLPFRITLPSGFTRTDPSTFTEDEIQAAGFTGPYVEPEYDPATQRLDWINGEYVINVLPPPTPQPQWQSFATALVAKPAINTLVATAATQAPVLHLMLGVGLGQAAQGDPSTFTTAWSQVLDSGLASPELAAEVAAHAQANHLPEAFISALIPVAPEPVRARNADGTFIADDPSTPDINEAWVQP